MCFKNARVVFDQEVKDKKGKVKRTERTLEMHPCTVAAEACKQLLHLDTCRVRQHSNRRDDVSMQRYTMHVHVHDINAVTFCTASDCVTTVNVLLPSAGVSRRFGATAHVDAAAGSKQLRRGYYDASQVRLTTHCRRENSVSN